MRKILISIIMISLAVFILNNTNAQTNIFPSTGSAGIGTTSPNASSLLEIRSTTKGLLISRMTLAQRNAVASPATGLLIYQTNSTPGFYYYNGSAWKAVATKAGWSLTGNANTDSSINFVGTTDEHSLVFRVGNLQAGLIEYSTCCSGKRNTAFGLRSLFSNTTGIENTTTGYGALYTNRTGSNNSAFGKYSLFNNNADNNTAFGYNTMFFNTSGINNTAVGSVALQNNTTGQQNTANGFAALASNSVGSYNTAAGSAALNNNSADNNTAAGAYALYLNTSGYSNVALGTQALYNNSNHSNLVAVGDSALYNNGVSKGYLDGVQNTALGSKALFTNTKGSNNTSTGYQALYYNTTGSFNNANGSYALWINSTGGGNTAFGGASVMYNSDGSYNTGVGYFALHSNTHGNFNTALGEASLATNTVGGFNTAIGYMADVSVNNLINATAIGANAIVNNYNKIRHGDASITVVESQVGSWTTSDGRFKNNIKENVKGLEFIKLLKPVTYNFDTKKFQEFLLQNFPDSIKSERLASIDKNAMTKASDIVQSGFIAQDVAEAVKKSGYNFNGVHAPEYPTDNWSISYEKLTVPLVKAVQELSAKNDDLQKQIDELKAMIVSNQSSVSSQQSATISLASLGQNIPNPFSNNTIINYSLPQKFTSAQIIIIDKNGKTLKAVNVSGGGKGILKVEASTLASGVYQYSLIVDGKTITTKQMLIAK